MTIGEELRAQLAAKNKIKSNGPLVTHPASDLSQVKPFRWAWRNRIVIGYLNLLVGEEGIGKGTLVAKLISMLSKGQLEGDYEGPVNVGIIGDEDGFYDVWVPRLYAAECDLDRVFQIEQPDGGYISLTDDVERIGTVVKEKELSFLYFDQLLDNLGTKVDDWRAKQVRDALSPARALGKVLSVAVFASLHPNKHGETFRNLVQGTNAFNAVSRSSLLLAADPYDKNKRVLVQGKGNLSALPAGVSFRIESEMHVINNLEHHVGVVPTFFESDWTAPDLLAAHRNGAKEPTQTDMAETHIRAFLPQDGKWHQKEVSKIHDACSMDGISKMAVSRARDRMGVTWRKTQEAPAKVEWCWKL